MIRPDGFRGAAFGTVADGDGRHARDLRAAIGRDLDISEDWATIRQVHGSTVLVATEPGSIGAADGLITEVLGLPLAVATADCVPVILEGAGSTVIVHAGWRGLAARVVERALDRMHEIGDRPLRMAIGPAIGPCCYEVGDEVIAGLGGFEARTTWGAQSVDLAAAVAAQAGDVEIWRADLCTYTEPSFHSYREDGTDARQVAVTWLPDDSMRSKPGSRGRQPAPGETPAT
jgi:YfiH family protein